LLDYASYGYEIGTLWSTVRHYQATNLVFKYYHTYQDGAEHHDLADQQSDEHRRGVVVH
jgi:hypothetical protein